MRGSSLFEADWQNNLAEGFEPQYLSGLA